MSSVKVVSVDSTTLAVTLDVDGQSIVATPFQWGSKMLMKVKGNLDRGTRISVGARAKAAVKNAGLQLPTAVLKRPRKPKEEATEAPVATGSEARVIPIAASGEARVTVEETSLEAAEAEAPLTEAADEEEAVTVVTARQGERVRIAYDALDVDTLRGLCKARGLRGYSDKKKADLIALLDGEVAEAA